MLDSSKMEYFSSQGYSFKDIAEASSRGAIIGVEGHPGMTDAGEFTIIA